MKRLIWIGGLAFGLVAVVACGGDDGDGSGGGDEETSSGSSGTGARTERASSSSGAAPSSSGAGASSGAAVDTELQAACEAIATAKVELDCGNEEYDAIVVECVAGIDQRNGTCAAEYRTDALCRAPLGIDKYECVNGIAELKLGIPECDEEGKAVIGCFAGGR